MADMILTSIEMCKNCPDRRMVDREGQKCTCHTVCDKYKSARAERDKELFARYEQSQLENAFYKNVTKQVDKNKRK